jgi:hypothetical protein
MEEKRRQSATGEGAVVDRRTQRLNKAWADLKEGRVSVEVANLRGS